MWRPACKATQSVCNVVIFLLYLKYLQCPWFSVFTRDTQCSAFQWPLHWTTLHCIVLHCNVLHCNVRHCIALHFILPHWTMQRSTLQHCTVLRGTRLYHTALLCTHALFSLHPTLLQRTSLHWTKLQSCTGTLCPLPAEGKGPLDKYLNWQEAGQGFKYILYSELENVGSMGAALLLSLTP